MVHTIFVLGMDDCPRYRQILPVTMMPALFGSMVGVLYGVRTEHRELPHD
jgi:hypothetical protein